jgi:hypothetical protein
VVGSTVRHSAGLNFSPGMGVDAMKKKPNRVPKKARKLKTRPSGGGPELAAAMRRIGEEKLADLFQGEIAREVPQ